MPHCARPPFAQERLRKAGNEWFYRCTKQYSEPGHGQRGKPSAKGKTGDELHLTQPGPYFFELKKKHKYSVNP